MVPLCSVTIWTLLLLFSFFKAMYSIVNLVKPANKVLFQHLLIFTLIYFCLRKMNVYTDVLKAL